MTVPTDSLSSHGPSGGKVRLPIPALPSEHPLKGSNPNHPTQRNPRSSGQASSSGAQNSLLSSWLSNAHSSNRVNSSSTTGGQAAGSGTDGSHHQINTKDESTHRADSEVSSSAKLEEMDIDEPHQDPSRSSTGDEEHDPSPGQAAEDAPGKTKKGRKAKAKTEADKPDPANIKSKTAKAPKEKTASEPKQPKQPKDIKQKKSTVKNSEDTLSPGNQPAVATTAAAVPGQKSDRSILSFFDRSTAPTSKGALIQHAEDQPHEENTASTPPSSSSKTPFKQSCLQFDKLDPSKTDSYFANMAAASVEEDKRFGGLLKELPKLTGRAPYEDLLDGLIMRSSKLPSINKLDLHRQDLDMDMLADVKMVHEFINTFGSPLGLTKDSGEWITYDALLGMIRNPRVDNRLLDLNCKMIIAAYDEGKSPAINNFNFPYFLAIGPATLEDKKEEKKSKMSSVSAKRKVVPQVRLATTEYSRFTASDRIEALVKALHDITSSDRFHRFMRNEVEENITSLKRHKRKRAEVRKELETQTHDLEREMRTIEYEAAQLETQRQAILTTERENTSLEEEAAGNRISSSSRLQRLAHAKDARNKANDLLNQQKAMANDLKIKESAWEIKKEELDNISLDDNELQKEHNIPLSQLRGGQAVNGDEKLRIICLGNDRWGRKYWFWRQFGGIIVEDRKQLGPKMEDTIDKSDEAATSEDSKPQPEDGNDTTMADVTERMKSMAEPDLTGQKTQSTKEVMSINNLLSSSTPPAEESSPFTEPETPPPPKDLLDYGQTHTWGLISTGKELASLIRALNSKGIREKYLKASLVTMRKDIEASFKLVPTWIGREVVVRQDKSKTAEATVGQLLNEHDLMVLKRKRGRKSRQELADIAATEMVLASNEDRQGMDFDMSTEADSNIGGQDEPMDEGHENDEPIHEEDESSLASFLRVVRDEGSGPTRSEYYNSLVQAAEKRLHELSKTICDTEDNVISKAIRDSLELTPESRLDATVRVLQQCLLAMDQPEEKEIAETSTSTTESDPASTTDSVAMDVDATEGASSVVDRPSPVICSVPVIVNARLLAWLRACHIETMLKSVRTFGALHAWLDDCLTLIANRVDEPEDGDDEEEEENRSDREKEHEEEDADQDEHDEEEEEEDEDDEHDHDDDEAEEAGGHKGQNYKKAQHRGSDSDAKNRGRHRKPHQETEMQFSNVGGRSLRARGAQPISYKDDLKALEEEGDDDDEEDEDAVVEEENDEEDGEERLGRGSRRRSKRTRH